MPHTSTHLTATPTTAGAGGQGLQGAGGGSTLNITSTPNPQAQVSKRKETLEAKRERKAAKTLAIITGAFVVCWLPFFLTALLLPLCESCAINDTVASLFLWLGYFNSTLNPVIYTIFSPEFRQAFKRILFGTKTLLESLTARATYTGHPVPENLEANDNCPDCRTYDWNGLLKDRNFLRPNSKLAIGEGMSLVRRASSITFARQQKRRENESEDP
uniref:G-protein coupled receptors family 1 profile domain-containing protein n=1 Tax=Anopheles atroparvus TaxID=41427 RepID=A0AAG5DGD2_ANOAO